MGNQIVNQQAWNAYMFGKRIDLFRLFGFEIRINLSWVLLVFLVAWSLSVGLFPFRYEGLSTQSNGSWGL